MVNLYLKRGYWLLTTLILSFVLGMILAAWVIEFSSGFAYMGTPSWTMPLLLVSIALVVLGAAVRPLRPSSRGFLKLGISAIVLTVLTTLGFILLASAVIGMLSE